MVKFAPKRQRSATNLDEMKKQEWMGLGGGGHGGEQHREWHTFFGGIIILLYNELELLLLEGYGYNYRN